MAFKEFETEEAYNEAINAAIEEKNQSWITERISRAEEKVRSEYADYDQLKEAASGAATVKADYEKKLAEANDQIASANAKAAKAEADSLKLNVAAQFGIPYDIAQRLNGSTKEELEADAQKLSQYIAQPKQGAPLRNPESEVIDGVTAAFRKMNPNLKF